MHNLSEVNQRRKKFYRKTARVFDELKKHGGGLVDAFGMPAGHVPDSFFQDDVDKKVELENRMRAISGYLSSLTWVVSIPDHDYEEEFKNFGKWAESSSTAAKLFSSSPKLLNGKSLKNEQEIEEQIQNIINMYKENLDNLAKEIKDLSDVDKTEFTSDHAEFLKRQLYAEYYGRLSALLWVLGKTKEESTKYIEQQLGPSSIKMSLIFPDTA